MKKFFNSYCVCLLLVVAALYMFSLSQFLLITEKLTFATSAEIAIFAVLLVLCVVCFALAICEFCEVQKRK